VSAIDRAKIQAEVLVPIFRRLESTMGRPEALALLGAAIGDMVRASTAAWVRPMDHDQAVAVTWRGIRTKANWETMHPLVVEERQTSGEVAEFDVVECGYATFFNEIGEPDLGFLLTCSADHHMLDLFPEIELTRTQTRMQGAAYCDFRYRRRPDRTAASAGAERDAVAVDDPVAALALLDPAEADEAGDGLVDPLA
jgi:hypothetical protein